MRYSNTWIKVKNLLFKKEGELWLAHDYTVDADKVERKVQIIKILEDSIKVLITQIEKNKLNPIREKLRDPKNMWQGLHEVYVASNLCKITKDIELEVPNPDHSQSNFDIKANINGTEINIEVTTRTDYFPFDKEFLSKVRGNEAESEVWTGLHSRATVSPAFINNNQPSSSKIQHDSIPESEDLRRKLLDKAKKQLPKNGINIIALGYRDITKANFHITSALYGDPKYGFDKSLSPEERTPFINRVKNGLCCEEDFRHISAVILIFPHTHVGTLYINPNPAKRLPLSVQESLVEIFNLEVGEQGG